MTVFVVSLYVLLPFPMESVVARANTPQLPPLHH